MRLERGIHFSDVCIVLLGAVGVAIFLRQMASEVTPLSLDSRSYFEMIIGYVRHGAPYLTIEESPLGCLSLLRWRVPVGEVFWLKYPPFYPWLMGVLVSKGGLSTLPLWHALLVVPLAMGVYIFARQLLCSRAIAAGVTVLSVLGSPVATQFLDIHAYPLMITLVVWTIIFFLLSIERDSPWLAFLAGGAGGGALATHPLCLVLVLGLFVGQLVLGCRVHPRRALLRTLFAGGALLVVLTPVAMLNLHRFGTLNPISYGPCPWVQCTPTTFGKETIEAALPFLVPTVLVLMLGYLLLRTSVSLAWKICLGGVAAVVVAFSWIEISSVVRLFSTFLIDASLISFMPRAEVRGNFLGPEMVLSLFQSQPALIMSACGLFFTAVRARVFWMALFPSFLLLLSLSARGAMEQIHALGFPFLHFRYLNPVIPLLLVSVGAAIRREQIHVGWLMGSLLALGLLLSAGESTDYLQVVVFRDGSLWLALSLAVVWYLRGSPKAKHTLLSIAIGYGVGVSVLRDAREVLSIRSTIASMSAEIKPHLPYGSVLLSEEPTISQFGAMTMERGIVIGDPLICGDALGTELDRILKERENVYLFSPSGVVYPQLRAVGVILDRVRPAVPLFKISRAPVRVSEE